MNYTAATEILKEQFGKTQAIISAYMENLLQILARVGDKYLHLLLVYDKIHVNVQAFGVRAEQYGSLEGQH